MLLLYSYWECMVSSRKIERACYKDLALRVLTGNQQPDCSRISESRRRHLSTQAELIVQALRPCQKAGLVSLRHVALAGTKVKANPGKHNAESRERMLKSEQQVEAEMRALPRKAEFIDAQGDSQVDKDKRVDEMRADLEWRTSRLE